MPHIMLPEELSAPCILDLKSFKLKGCCCGEKCFAFSLSGTSIQASYEPP